MTVRIRTLLLSFGLIVALALLLASFFPGLRVGSVFADVACSLNDSCAGVVAIPHVRVLTSNATSTFEVSPNAAYLIVEVWGAGGGGGGAIENQGKRGTGGGGGAYAYKVIRNPEASYPYRVGAGGAGGSTSATPSFGSTGGSTFFGSSAATAIVASGGLRGRAGVGQAIEGQPGGVATGGDLNIRGSDSFTINETLDAGWGGDAPRGGAGCKMNVTFAGYSPGGGGCAANHTTGSVGGAGANGLIIVTEYILEPVEVAEPDGPPDEN